MIIVCQTLLKNTKNFRNCYFSLYYFKDKGLKNNHTLINHEKIHLRQQLEMGIILFYLWYLAEFLYWYIKLGNGEIAYEKISFEQEAYRNENSLNYLKNRKFWEFLKYLP